MKFIFMTFGVFSYLFGIGKLIDTIVEFKEGGVLLGTIMIIVGAIMFVYSIMTE